MITECIETESDLARMRGMKCDAGQGYNFSRPLPDADFRALAMASPNNAFTHQTLSEADSAKYRPGQIRPSLNSSTEVCSSHSAFRGALIT